MWALKHRNENSWEKILAFREKDRFCLLVPEGTYNTRVSVTKEWFSEAGWTQAGHGCAHRNSIPVSMMSDVWASPEPGETVQ